MSVSKGQKLNKLNQLERYMLGRIMEPICTKDADGFAVYAEGWDDERCILELQKVVGREVSPHAVGDFRRAVFGNFRRATSNSAPSQNAVIAELKAQIAELQAENGKLKQSLKEKEEAIEAIGTKLIDVLLRLEAVERGVMPPQRKLDLPPAAE